MIANRTAGLSTAPRRPKPTAVDPESIDYAVHLVHQVCCFAGVFELLAEFRDPALGTWLLRRNLNEIPISDWLTANLPF